MTWFTTWPSAKGVEYAPHATEQKAATHAEELVRSGRAKVATYFELDGLEASA